MDANQKELMMFNLNQHFKNKGRSKAPIKQTGMTPERLKSENPDLYSSIFAQGIAQERKRISGWINSDIQNKWQLRDGILSGEQVETHGQAEIEDFYSSVDAKLKGNQGPVKKGKRKKSGSATNDLYAQQELNDFYAEVDKQIKK